MEETERKLAEGRKWRMERLEEGKRIYEGIVRDRQLRAAKIAQENAEKAKEEAELTVDKQIAKALVKINEKLASEAATFLKPFTDSVSDLFTTNEFALAKVKHESDLASIQSKYESDVKSLKLKLEKERAAREMLEDSYSIHVNRIQNELTSMRQKQDLHEVLFQEQRRSAMKWAKCAARHQVEFDLLQSTIDELQQKLKRANSQAQFYRQLSEENRFDLINLRRQAAAQVPITSALSCIANRLEQLSGPRTESGQSSTPSPVQRVAATCIYRLPRSLVPSNVQQGSAITPQPDRGSQPSLQSTASTNVSATSIASGAPADLLNYQNDTRPPPPPREPQHRTNSPVVNPPMSSSRTNANSSDSVEPVHIDTSSQKRTNIDDHNQGPPRKLTSPRDNNTPKDANNSDATPDTQNLDQSNPIPNPSMLRRSISSYISFSSPALDLIDLGMSPEMAQLFSDMDRSGHDHRTESQMANRAQPTICWTSVNVPGYEPIVSDGKWVSEVRGIDLDAWLKTTRECPTCARHRLEGKSDVFCFHFVNPKKCYIFAP
ncbi:hypothetical protein OCU04_010383 [Sclerotinia nivalis]|uniref:Uncharacterized protein n=1 Tax=Sclerotinia nivalis TaxID=352851 RepID=A0A9X0DG85_9HELO|nr:hypothetical protein OCU04_010383 [Sclerotinia nivalis]